MARDSREREPPPVLHATDLCYIVANACHEGRTTRRLALAAMAIGVGEELDELLEEEAREHLSSQARALQQAAQRVDRRFVAAVRLLFACEGRVVVAGMGKSGIVARKIAATLACTGAPALFLHPAEAAHGDLGVVTSDDVIVLVSRSGETAEIVRLLPHFQALEVPIIALTGDPTSTMARAATVVVDASVERESCPHGIVPTTSALVAQALGDALALAVLRERVVTAGDLIRLHPNDDPVVRPAKVVPRARTRRG